MASRRWMFAALPFVAVAITAAAFPQFRNTVLYGPTVGAGVAAELGCAGVFVMGRQPKEVADDDLAPFDPILARATLAVDTKQESATATLFGLASRTAIYRPGLGCTLLNQRDEASIHGQAAGLKLMPRQERPAPWPAGDAVDLDHLPIGVDRAALEAAITEAFRETTLDAPPPVSGLHQGTDGRETITLRQLLQMRSGLDFAESYGPGDDSTAMLFGQDDMAAYAATRPLGHKPGTFWSYSSGTANILAHLAFDAAGGTVPDAYAYAREYLFEPGGMTSAVFEPDGTGAFVGSSYLYMTARDWARFGELYLDGVSLNGERLLPADWVEFSHTGGGKIDEPGGYGALWWLNSDGSDPPSVRWLNCPPDTYMAMGHNDQIVAVVPSRKLVFVRLGWTTGGAEFDTDRHLSHILASLHDDQ